MNSVMMDRELGSRCFVKDDGFLYVTVPTGALDDTGAPVYEDRCISQSGMDAQGALTAAEYREVDRIVMDEAKKASRYTTWLKSLKANVTSINGLKYKTYWYQRIKGNTASRSTMDLEDDSPAVGVSYEEDGVPLPFEFADWLYNIRRDGTANTSAGFDVTLEKARLASKSVATGLDLRNINGWDGLKYRGVTVYGLRDVPANMTVAQSKDWLTVSTPQEIYADIVKMVAAMNEAGIPGPYVLQVPSSFRFRLAETYHENQLTDNAKSLWTKLLEKPSADVPNVLDIAQIKLIDELNQKLGGGTPDLAEAYLTTLDPEYFRVLDYMPSTSFTMELKGMISTKHRVVEGVCPLWKVDGKGNRGIVKLVAPNGSGATS